MHSLAVLLTLMAGPAFSAGLEIGVTGESVNGTIKIDLLEDVAPLHVAQITALAADVVYDGVIFHRVINGFMAQTGDVKFGKDPSDTSRAGMGGSDLANIPAEFSDVPFDRGIVGMARSQSPDSANSQFFICLSYTSYAADEHPFLGLGAPRITHVNPCPPAAPSSSPYRPIRMNLPSAADACIH